MQSPTRETPPVYDPTLELSDESIGEPWPLSRFSRRDFARLRTIANATRQPITVLLKKAVEVLWQATEAERLAHEQWRVAFLREQGVSCRNRYETPEPSNIVAGDDALGE